MESRGDRWTTRLLGEVLLRLVYFVVFFAVTLFISLRVVLFSSTPWPNIWVACIVGAIAATVGPWLYSLDANLGQGTLKDIRERSKGRR